MRKKWIKPVIAVASVGVATLSLTAAGSALAGATQPNFSCLTDSSYELIATHGITGHAEISIDTAKSKRGHVTAYIFSDFGDNVRSTDGANHTVTGTVSLQLEGQAQRHPTTFTIHATPESDAHGGESDARLHGVRYVGQRVRAVIRVFGHQYSSGWATVGHGEPFCEP